MADAVKWRQAITKAIGQCDPATTTAGERALIVASFGTLSLTLTANAGQFQAQMHKAAQTAHNLKSAVTSAVVVAGKMNNLRVGRDLPEQLEATGRELRVVERNTAAATAGIRGIEESLTVASSAATVASSALALAGRSMGTMGAAASGASVAMSGALINVMGLRRAVQTLGTVVGLAADGIKTLLLPLRLVGSGVAMAARSFGLLLLPVRMVASAAGLFLRVLTLLVSPMLSVAGVALKAYLAFKAFQIQAKILRAVMDSLPPRAKVVAGALVAIGAATRTASAALGMFGVAGRAAASALSAMALPLRLIVHPIRTATAAVGMLTRAVKALVSTALAPLKLALSPLMMLAAGAGMLKLAADAETLQLQMSVLTKDAKLAARVIAELNAFANQTPFSKLDIKAAARQLLAAQVPVAQLITDLQILGNIAAGTEVPLRELADVYARMRVSGRVTMVDINMLQGRGIDIVTELTKRFGNLQQAVQNNQVGFADIRAALLALTTGAGTFAGMIDRLSESLSGQFSKLKNNIIIAATAIGEQMAPAVKSVLEQVNRLIEGFMQIPNKIEFVGKVIAAAFDVAFASIGDKWDALVRRKKVSWFNFMMQVAGAGITIPGVGGGRIVPKIKPAAAGRSPALVAAQAALDGLLDQLKKPAPKVPALQAPPAAEKAAGNAIAGLLDRLKVDANVISWGVRGMLDRAQIRGGAFMNMLRNWFGGDGDAMQAQQSQTAAAMQRGSADAFSTIVQNMLSNRDPVEKAVNKGNNIAAKGFDALADGLGAIAANMGVAGP